MPHLRQVHGSIINVSSLVGTIGQEWSVTYVATKGAIIAMTKALRETACGSTWYCPEAS